MTADQERRIQTICLAILCAIAIGCALAMLRSVLVPFVLALFFAIALTPLVEWQIRRLKAPRVVAVVATLFLGGLILVVLGGLVTASVSQMSARAGDYQAYLGTAVTRAFDAMPEWVDRPDVEEVFARAPAFVGDSVLGLLGGLSALVGDGLVVLIFLFFLLTGAGHRVARGSVEAEIETRVKRYILTKAAVSLVTGVLVGLTLALCGVDLALVFGLLAFLLNFIPNVGSIIASVLPLPVVLLSPDLGAGAKITAALLPMAAQFLIGNVLEPKIMSESVDLRPVVILLALIFWGALWGIVGMLLAVPITASLRILLARLELTAPLAAMLGQPEPT